jgi:hypothetical protein
VANGKPQRDGKSRKFFVRWGSRTHTSLPNLAYPEAIESVNMSRKQIEISNALNDRLAAYSAKLDHSAARAFVSRYGASVSHGATTTQQPKAASSAPSSPSSKSGRSR